MAAPIKTNPAQMSIGILIINTVLSSGALIYARDTERRLATMEANVSMLMRAVDLVPRTTAQNDQKTQR